MINVTSITSFRYNSDNLIQRRPIARRLRAPLMGRALTTASNDSNHINNYDKNELMELDKRRFGLTSSGQRIWIGLKRRGPLFG